MPSHSLEGVQILLTDPNNNTIIHRSATTDNQGMVFLNEVPDASQYDIYAYKDSYILESTQQRCSLSGFTTNQTFYDNITLTNSSCYSFGFRQTVPPSSPTSCDALYPTNQFRACYYNGLDFEFSPFLISKIEEIRCVLLINKACVLHLVRNLNINELMKSADLDLIK